MAEYLIKDTTLTGIADAIRSKTGGTDPIVVSDMANQIEGISGGGGGKPAVIEPLNVTENGTYTPSDGVDGFSPVTVNVAASGGEDEWYITNASYLFYTGARLNAKDALLKRLKDVTDMANMFWYCYSLTSLDVSNFDTSKVTNMNGVFSGCKNLTSLEGFSATNKAGLNIGFPYGDTSSPFALKRLTFRTDLPDGVYSIRSAINIKYCSFDRDGMVEMFNTLPDVSGLGLSSSYTTITITGNPCILSTVTLAGSQFNTTVSSYADFLDKADEFYKGYNRTGATVTIYKVGGSTTVDIDTVTEEYFKDYGVTMVKFLTFDATVPDSMKLTAEDEAIATSKGWTLVK